jgi:AraC-like DNA-binding protein
VRTQAPWLGLALSREYWELPLRRRDAVLQSVLLRKAQQIASRLPENDAVVAELRRWLMARLAQGDSDIESVARPMATSVRSLQRRLASTGTTYQEVLDSTRREAAGRYLSHSRSARLDTCWAISEPAAFHRAFKRWYGTTPHEFRRPQKRTTSSVPCIMENQAPGY